VGLLHTQVHASIGAEEHHAYAPSELSFLLRSGYDYWALGHVHVRQMLADDPPVWYPGSLQGRTHADRGERGALLVDLSDRGSPIVSFRSLAPVRWETIEVDRLEGVGTLDELERQIQLVWDAARAGDPGSSGTEWMTRVVLSGPCPLWTDLRSQENAELLARELAELLGALEVTVLVDGVYPVLSLDEHRGRVDVLGEALRLVAAVRRGEARIPGLEHSDLAGVPSDDPAAVERYVRDLLGGLDGEIAARLLVGRSS
jgi:hypothetical protein